MKQTLRRVAVLAGVLAAGSGPAWSGYVNTTTGGPLRPGVYGRIDIGRASPPPLIYTTPVVASRAVPSSHAKPVYLYVPPGQVRKWPKFCGKYQACGVPVYFVRMENSPSRLGKWKSRSDMGNRGAGLVALRMPQSSRPPGFRD